MTANTKKKLLGLIARIRRARNENLDETSHLAEFEETLSGADISNLCRSDLDDVTVLDICLGNKSDNRSLTRDELLALVRRVTGQGDPFKKESDSIRAALLFKANCKHPAGTDLIFWPDDHFDGRGSPSAEEIVEKALNGY